MTNETKHTPTPWDHLNNVFTMEDGYFSMIQTPDQCIANVFDEADAAHIVKCVNMHDELVERLRELLELTDDTDNDADECESVFVAARETLKKAGAL